jgi:hypothetical protein
LPVEPQHFEQAPRVDRPPSTTSSSSTLLACHSGAAFDYQIFVTDPKYQFATAELDSIVSGVPTGTKITMRIFGFADIVSFDGSNEPGVPVSGTVLTVQNIWDVPAGAVLNSFQDTYTQRTRVPGPLPLFGAAMGFAFSRRLRSRIRSARRSA